MVIKQQMNHVRPFEEREKRKMSPTKEDLVMRC